MNGKVNSILDPDFPDGWQYLVSLKHEVNKKLDAAVKEGSLDKRRRALITLYLNGSGMAAVLRTTMFNPRVALSELFSAHTEIFLDDSLEEAKIQVSQSPYKECERCLRSSSEWVEEHPYWPGFTLCARCVWVLLEMRWPPYTFREDGSVYIFANEGSFQRWKTGVCALGEMPLSVNMRTDSRRFGRSL